MVGKCQSFILPGTNFIVEINFIVPQVAKLINITESTVKRWFKEWEISVHGKMGNISTLDVRTIIILTEFSNTGFKTDKH